MCNNFYLQEREVEEHLRDLQNEADRQRVVAVLPGQRRRGQIYRASRWKHLVSRLGTRLVALGTGLERVEQHDKQAVATYR